METTGSFACATETCSAAQEILHVPQKRVSLTQEFCMCHRNVFRCHRKFCMCRRNVFCCHRKFCMCHKNVFCCHSKFCMCHRNEFRYQRKFCICLRNIYRYCSRLLGTPPMEGNWLRGLSLVEVMTVRAACVRDGSVHPFAFWSKRWERTARPRFL